jgi:cytochrome c biogenesis protein CcmG/thiol:disulfide interchange protein DsbE
MRAAVVFGLLVMVSACGTTDVTRSSEYVTLQDDKEALAADVERLESEAGASADELEQAQRELSQVQAATEAERAEADALRADFIAFLSTIFASQGGLADTESECAGTAVVEDVDMRQAYLRLLSGSDPESTETSSAVELLNTMLAGCGIDVPDSAEPTEQAAAAELPPDVAAAVRPVEVIGDRLPRLNDSTVAADPVIGLPAPVLIGEGYDGEVVRIDAAESGPTMVVFLAHWCPHCNAEMPRLQQLQADGLFPDGVGLVAVSTGLNPDAPNFPPDAWLIDMNWEVPTLADDIDLERQVFVASDAFGVNGFPFAVLIDADGTVAARWSGERSADDVLASLTEAFG